MADNGWGSVLVGAHSLVSVPCAPVPAILWVFPIRFLPLVLFIQGAKLMV